MSKYPKKNPPHPPFNLTSSIENRPCGLTCCCWDWWPWASACPPSPRAKTPACWSGGTARSRSSSCPSVKRRKDGRAVSRRGLAATAERTFRNAPRAHSPRGEAGWGSCDPRRRCGCWRTGRWKWAKLRSRWNCSPARPEMPVWTQGGTFITRVITVFTADYS